MFSFLFKLELIYTLSHILCKEPVATLITPTHSSFIIRLHILIAAVESSHCGFFYGREVEVEWLYLLCFINICAFDGLNVGEKIKLLTQEKIKLIVLVIPNKGCH